MLQSSWIAFSQLTGMHPCKKGQDFSHVDSRFSHSSYRHKNYTEQWYTVSGMGIWECGNENGLHNGAVY